MVERNYAAGDLIVKQGQGGEGFYVLISGKAEATRERSDGEKIVVNHFGASDFFGELALLDEEGVRTASIVAGIVFSLFLAACLSFSSEFSTAPASRVERVFSKRSS